jgi:hypothetical protein
MMSLSHGSVSRCFDSRQRRYCAAQIDQTGA